MYISEINKRTQTSLTRFCERNDLSFEIWDNPMGGLETATFFFHDDERLFVVATRKMITIYCDNECKNDWIFIETKDYYQLIW